MKTAKRIICLVMAVIMLFTGTPALQASDLGLDKAQMAELQQDILQGAKRDLNPVKDPVKELIARHALVKKTPEELAHELIERVKGIDVKASFNEFLELKRQAEEVAATDPKYAIIKSKSKREKVAFFTIMETNLKEFVKKNERTIQGILAFIGLIISPFVVALLAELLSALGLMGLAAVLSHLAAMLEAAVIIGSIGAAFAAIVALLLTLPLLFSSAYVPVISPNLSDEETFEIFVEDPFGMLAKFGDPDFYLMYGKGPKCAQVLDDATYIEEYIALHEGKLDFDSEMIPLHTRTIGYIELPSAKKGEYLHKFAELFKSQATSFRW